MIIDGMISHIKAGSPFLMYPRFVQLFLAKSLEGVPKPQDFIPTIVLPQKVFTFMSHKVVKFSGQNTPLTAHILEVAQAVRDDVNDEECDYAHSEHSASEHTSTPPLASPQQIASSEKTTSLSVPVRESREKTISIESTSQHPVSKESTSLQGTASEHDTPSSPNDYTYRWVSNTWRR
jgi:hypothetical protein